MPTTSISITPEFKNSIVTQINCGTSSPKLSGTIDISTFSNLQAFRCNSNDITALSGYADNSNLSVVQFFNNKITDSIPNLDLMTNLQDFRCDRNQLTGSIPSLSELTNLQIFQCDRNQLTGTIPNLSELNNLQDFSCHTNQLTGSIPSLSGNPVLRSFWCHTNQLTGFDGGSISNTLGDFRAQSNQLTSAAVNAILAAFVAANRTVGTRILNLGGTGNAAPTGQGIIDVAFLDNEGWTVTVVP